MGQRNQAGALAPEEKKVIASLLARGWRNQDIQALINIERPATINSARVTEVKKSGIRPAPDDATDFFVLRKRSYDVRTGLNLFDDERLIRSREAMALAVQTFNSATTNFKTEVFAMLANVAWTYLLHEYYQRKKIPIEDSEGRTLPLSQIVRREDCPLSKGIRRNLTAIKEIRDNAEHKTLGRSDVRWLSLFQACCLNYDKTLCDLFGEKLSLQKDLSFALQFARLSVDQISEIQRYEIPEHIDALDARLDDGLTEEELADLEYRFRVVYTLDSASKSHSHIQFLHPDSPQAEQVRNVLIKYRLSDELYPHKASVVTKLVKERSLLDFNSHHHTQAWRKFKARPRKRARDPSKTNRDYCVYHEAHRDYTYSDAWVEFLVGQISTPDGFDAIRRIKV